MFTEKKHIPPFPKKKGMTIIEGLILLAIFSIITMAFYEGFLLGTNHILNAKKRLLAVGIATEKMESLRSLSYSEVAVSGGVPDGLIDPDETVNTSGNQFHVLISIVYVDDPDDGTLAGGTDAIYNDYKLTEIRVLWGEETPSETVTMSSLFVPTGLETASGGGILSVNVIDVNGAPVQNASVHIQNNNVSPVVNTTLITGVNGNVSLVGAIASSQKYVITVSKSGYETVVTLPPYPTSSYYPIDVHMTAVEDTFTTGIFVSSLLADLALHFQDPLGTSVSSVNFTLEGGRVIGTTTGFEAVYNYSESLVTDASGDKSLNDMSPGGYRLSLSEPGYQLWKVEYGTGNEEDQVVLNPGANLAATVFLVQSSRPGYFVKILDQSNGNPAEGANVKLENASISYSVEEQTDSFGYAYFPREEIAVLIDGTSYDVTVTHPDYETKTKSVVINGLTSETVNLEPNP